MSICLNILKQNPNKLLWKNIKILNYISSSQIKCYNTNFMLSSIITPSTSILTDKYKSKIFSINLQSLRNKNFSCSYTTKSKPDVLNDKVSKENLQLSSSKSSSSSPSSSSSSSKEPYDKDQNTKEQQQEKQNDENQNEIQPPQLDTEKLGLFAKFKLMYKQYWYVLIPVHVITSIGWFGGFYYLSKSGVDIPSLLQSLHISESIIDRLKGSQMGHIAVAYLCYKIATPARYAVTVGGTTISIKYLVQAGYIKPLPTRSELIRMYEETKAKRKQDKENKND